MDQDPSIQFGQAVIEARPQGYGMVSSVIDLTRC